MEIGGNRWQTLLEAWHRILVQVLTTSQLTSRNWWLNPPLPQLWWGAQEALQRTRPKYWSGKNKWTRSECVCGWGGGGEGRGWGGVGSNKRQYTSLVLLFFCCCLFVCLFFLFFLFFLSSSSSFVYFFKSKRSGRLNASLSERARRLSTEVTVQKDLSFVVKKDNASWWCLPWLSL